MSKKTAFIVLALVLALAMAFTGCTTARKPMTTPAENNMAYNRTQYPNSPIIGDNWGIRDWNNNYRTDIYNTNMNNNGNATRTNVNNNVNTTTTKSDTIAKACDRVQGVKNSTVVVTGNTAYVGIDTDKNTMVANERDIKKKVSDAVRAADPNINTVYVSGEMNFMNRLREVGTGLKSGRPVDAFTTELKNMVQSITPTKW